MALYANAVLRMLPPPEVAYQVQYQVITSANPLPITGVPGQVKDLPVFIASAMNNWIGVCEVGTTANRPTVPDPSRQVLRGLQYIDTTLGKVIMHDGATWRDVLNGNAV